jgi:hypothetical protein
LRIWIWIPETDRGRNGDDATSKFIPQINANRGSSNKATRIKIEKLVKMQKNHRCAWDFDNVFICGVQDREDDIEEDVVVVVVVVVVNAAE